MNIKHSILKNWKFCICCLYWVLNSFSASAQDVKPVVDNIHFPSGVEVNKQIVAVNANDIEISYKIQNNNDFTVEQEFSFSIPEEMDYFKFPINPTVSDVRIDDRMRGNYLYYYRPFNYSDNYRNFRFFINDQKIFPDLEKITVREKCIPDYCYRRSSRFSWVQTLAPQASITLKTIYNSQFGYISARGHKPELFAFLIESQSANFRQYCANNAFVEAIRKQQKVGFLTVYDRHIDGKLILLDGDWQKHHLPLTQLIIDKGRAENLISFCGDDVKKISPTRFLIEQKNSKPITTNHILILKGWRKRAIDFENYYSEEYDPELLNYR